jgi:general secretion pathway protein F
MKNKKFTARIEIKRKITKHNIEAESLEKARRIAKTKGKVISLKESSSFSGFEIAMDTAERQVFLQRLSAMLASKVGTGVALELMSTTFTGPIKNVSTRMLKFVENGDSIGDAMEKIGTKHFTSQITALVRAGERGGNTALSLKNAAEFEMEMERVKKGAGAAIWMGIGGLIAAGFIILGTRFYLAPEVLDSPLMQMFGDIIEDKVAVFFTLADWTGYSMILIFAFLIFIFGLSTVGRATIPKKADKIIMKIPIVKDIVLAKNNYTSLYGLSMLIDSGVRMEEALRLSAEATPKGQMQEDLKAGFQAIKKGNPWALAMEGLHPTDKAALSTSQDREQVASSLSAIADQYKNIFASRVALTAPVLQGIAALYLILSGAILFGLTVVPMLEVAANGI